jgi:hypothetical protein
MRYALRILCTLTAFLAAFLLLNRLLGWPTSTLTLLGLVGISFFAGGLVSDLVSRRKGNRIGLMAITAISAVLVAGSLTVGWPWDYRLFFLRGPERWVMFKEEAALYLLSTEDNGPLENVLFSFTAPHIENKEIVDPDGNPAYKGLAHLFYLGENGALLQEAICENSKEGWKVYKFYGNRKEAPCTILYGVNRSSDTPTLGYVVDKLYPREVLWVVSVVWVPEREADKVSIIAYGGRENISLAEFARYTPSSLEPQKPSNV